MRAGGRGRGRVDRARLVQCGAREDGDQERPSRCRRRRGDGVPRGLPLLTGREDGRDPRRGGAAPGRPGRNDGGPRGAHARPAHARRRGRRPGDRALACPDRNRTAAGRARPRPRVRRAGRGDVRGCGAVAWAGGPVATGLGRRRAGRGRPRTRGGGPLRRRRPVGGRIPLARAPRGEPGHVAPRQRRCRPGMACSEPGTVRRGAHAVLRGAPGTAGVLRFRGHEPHPGLRRRGGRGPGGGGRGRTHRQTPRPPSPVPYARLTAAPRPRRAQGRAAPPPRPARRRRP